MTTNQLKRLEIELNRRSNLERNQEQERTNRENERLKGLQSLRDYRLGSKEAGTREFAARSQDQHYSRLDAETARSNQARETEAHRANLAGERENFRANVARENETQRHNLKAEELQGFQNAFQNKANEINIKTRAAEAQNRAKQLELQEQALGFDRTKAQASMIGALAQNKNADTNQGKFEFDMMTQPMDWIIQSARLFIPFA